jgi:hypothetical protein
MMLPPGGVEGKPTQPNPRTASMLFLPGAVGEPRERSTLLVTVLATLLVTLLVIQTGPQTASTLLVPGTAVEPWN